MCCKLAFLIFFASFRMNWDILRLKYLVRWNLLVWIEFIFDGSLELAWNDENSVFQAFFCLWRSGKMLFKKDLSSRLGICVVFSSQIKICNPCKLLLPRKTVETSTFLLHIEPQGSWDSIFFQDYANDHQRSQFLSQLRSTKTFSLQNDRKSLATHFSP